MGDQADNLNENIAEAQELLGALGIISVLSYNLIAGVQVMNLDLNGILDFVSSQNTLPVGGLLIAVFVGWQVSRETLRAELADLP